MSENRLQMSDFDPLDEAMLEDPYPTFARLRAQCPVARSEQYDGFWGLTKYEDVCAVAADHTTFINSVQNTVPRVRGGGRRPPIHFDPPDQTFYRRAMNSPFREERIAPLEPAIRDLTTRLIDAMIAQGETEVMREFASPLPLLALALVLDIPEDDAWRIERLVQEFADRNQEGDDAGARASSEVMMDYVRALVADRKDRPRDVDDDLVSSMLAAQSDDPNHEEYVVGAIRHLFVAVHVTLSRAITSMIRHLAGHPELVEELRARPAEIPDAVQELLRLYTPPVGFARTATRDVTIRDQEIKAGDVVVLMLPSANRDEEIFDRADEFDMHRDPNPHIAFGRGVHKCLGQRLALLVLRVVIEELVERVEAIEIVGPVVPSRWPSVGPAELPIRLTPR